MADDSGPEGKRRGAVGVRVRVMLDTSLAVLDTPTTASSRWALAPLLRFASRRRTSTRAPSTPNWSSRIIWAPPKNERDMQLCGGFRPGAVELRKWSWIAQRPAARTLEQDVSASVSSEPFISLRVYVLTATMRPSILTSSHSGCAMSHASALTSPSSNAAHSNSTSRITALTSTNDRTPPAHLPRTQTLCASASRVLLPSLLPFPCLPLSPPCSPLLVCHRPPTGASQAIDPTHATFLASVPASSARAQDAKHITAAGGDGDDPDATAG
ncbi:hypothetical protein B0H12DRAFT_1243988 [Mycena haematopus]|nr:hypothetical protein B0H12DRAFT_1243988 [Mycena haematopus]